MCTQLRYLDCAGCGDGAKMGDSFGGFFGRQLSPDFRDFRGMRRVEAYRFRWAGGRPPALTNWTSVGANSFLI
ncbi:hypothetical protein SBA4_5930003 [Candidatus Sulfopaludibacter sp. SbA4]|nr:hypothetical protein SBA4_5930003 [Candidatus Sulfopaludibacter sp. SbA4]